MKKNLQVAVWLTLVTTVLLGVAYPLFITALAQVLFPAQANGSLIEVSGRVVGSRLIGQPFSARGYFASRPSGAGAGYDALQSGSAYLAPSSRALSERVESAVRKLQAQNPGTPVPIDLVTQSASGLDPDISPAAAAFQVPRVARERGMSEAAVRILVARQTQGRALGFLGEPRVNVLELNLELDQVHPLPASASKR